MIPVDIVVYWLWGILGCSTNKFIKNIILNIVMLQVHVFDGIRNNTTRMTHAKVKNVVGLFTNMHDAEFKRHLRCTKGQYKVIYDVYIFGY